MNIFFYLKKLYHEILSYLATVLYATKGWGTYGQES